MLEVRGLTLWPGGKSDPLIRDVSFSISPGERVGVVGESGCGKTMTGLAILRLLPMRKAKLAGQICFLGRDLLALTEREMRSVRGSDIAMIFQEPMSALDPVFTVGEQIAEAYRAHRGAGRAEARGRAIEALSLIHI